jgi:tRNA threonylcarbamoyl adenosine modification protein (Sua5/YciO/YrdC/YwlC family)
MIFSSNMPEPDPALANLKKACELIKNGKIIVFPTETVYGLGCSINYPETIQQLFQIKRRPPKKPMQILIANTEQIKTLSHNLSPLAEEIIKKHTPGPFTFLVFKSMAVPDLVTCGSLKVGLHFPDHELAIKLINTCGPLVATSANISGEKETVTFAQAQAAFPDLFVLPGEEPKYRTASAVIDLTTPEMKILRAGPIKI